MKHVLISFEVKTESIEAAKAIISEFVTAIKKNEPETLMYKSFHQQNHPGKFVHVMTFANKDAEDFHRQTSYCQEFVKKLYPLCTIDPQAVSYNEIK